MDCLRGILHVSTTIGFLSKMVAGRINSVGDPLRIQRMTDHDVDLGDQHTDQVDQDTDPVGQYCCQYV